MRPRRVVTGHGEDGRPRIVEDAPLPRYVEREAIPGMSDGVVWATGADDGDTVGAGDPAAAVVSVVPGPGETRFLTVTLPPAAAFESPDFDPEAAAAEDAKVIPGLAELFDPEDPGMHTTPTVDYVIVLDGEVTLVLDGDEQTVVRQGDIVIQDGTRHAWRNLSDAPATLATVMIGRDPVPHPPGPDPEAHAAPRAPNQDPGPTAASRPESSEGVS
jgi:mannose-6-phosphate isomerase-like protein (cupin superfamily)